MCFPVLKLIKRLTTETVSGINKAFLTIFSGVKVCSYTFVLSKFCLYLNEAYAIGGVNEGFTPLEMAAAYASIANDGVYIEPTFYTKVEDKAGNIYLQPKPIEDRSKRVMSADNAYIIKSILKLTT